MRRLLPALAVLLLSSSSAVAQTAISSDQGRWEDTDTWLGAAVPLATDLVTIQWGNRVVITGATAVAEHIKLTDGGELIVGTGQSPTVLTVGPGIATTVDGIVCEVTGGVMTISPGATVLIDPDNATTTEEDGMILSFNGCVLNMRGHKAVQATVDRVVSDDGITDIVVAASKVVAFAAAYGGFAVTDFDVVWRTGEYKGRAMDIASISGDQLTIDFDSHQNAPTTTSGAETYAVYGPVVPLAGTIGGGGNTTLTVASQDISLMSGSRVVCVGSELAVPQRVVSGATTTWELDFAAACATSVIILDDNQPYPAVPHEEVAAAGDVFDIILPSSFGSENSTDGIYTEQTFIRVENGGVWHLKNVSIMGVGNADWAGGEGSGVRLSDIDGSVDPVVFDTVEIWRCAGEACLEFQDVSNMDIDWPFVHWTHPLIGASNEGHGIKIEEETLGHVTENVILTDGRVDRVNDDFYWWATTFGNSASTTSSAIRDSIGKYTPMTVDGDSGDCVDTLIEGTLQGNERGGGSFEVNRVYCSNIGTAGGVNGIYAGIDTSSSPVPEWRAFGVANSVVANIQDGTCYKAVTPGPAADWTNQDIWVANSVCLSAGRSGVDGIPQLAQVYVQDWGLSKNSVRAGILAYNRTMSSYVNGVYPFTSAVTSQYGISTTTTGVDWRYDGGGATITDTIVLSAGGNAGISYAEVSLPGFIATTALIDHTFVGTAWNLDSTLVGGTNFIALRVDLLGADHAALTFRAQDSIFSQPIRNARAVQCNASNTATDEFVSVFSWSAGAATTCDFSLNTITEGSGNSDNQSAGFTAWDLNIVPGSVVWDTATSDGLDKHGPRMAGVRVETLVNIPKLAGYYPKVVDPEGIYNVDSDGDGLINLWDNCQFVQNIGWADANENGIGDACE